MYPKLSHFQSEVNRRPYHWNFNGYFQDGPYELYIRLDRHRINDKVVKTFTLANVVNTRENLMGRGLFPFVLAKLEKLAEESDEAVAIFVENILNPRFEGFLRDRMKYTIYKRDCCIHAYKLLKPLTWGEGICSTVENDNAQV